MAVPKRFKFKTKKINFQKINNNMIFVKPQINKYFFKSLRLFLSVKIKSLLFWLKFFSSLLIVTLIFLNFNLNNFMSLILTSEFIIILIFFIFVFNSILLNLNWILGFSFIIIILGGLEIALSFILLNL